MNGMTADERAALAAAAGEVFTRYCTPERLARHEDRVDPELWAALADSGFTGIGVPEAAGGSGGGLTEAALVLRLAGSHAAPVPLAEASLLGGWLLAEAGLPLPRGIVTTGPADLSARPVAGGWEVTGTVRRVPAAADAELLVAPATTADGTVVVALPLAGLPRSDGRSVAGEARDAVAVATVVPTAAPVPDTTADELRLRGALSRALLIAGALDRVLGLTVRYARERSQFGRPIAAFQAVQQQVAALAAEAAAAGAAADAAVRTCEDGFSTAGAAFAVAAAKVRTAQAAGTGAAIAHQVHGALGFTHEHRLRFSTTRLWAWRSEWGSEAAWSEELADAAFRAVGQASGQDRENGEALWALWPLVVGA